MRHWGLYIVAFFIIEPWLFADPITIAAVVGGIGVHMGTIALGAAVLGVASAWHLDHQQKKQQRRLEQQMAASNIQGMTTTIREPAAVKRIYYGKDIRMGGNQVFIHTTYTNNGHMYMVIPFAPHELGSDFTVYLGETELTLEDDTSYTGWKVDNATKYAGWIRFRWHPDADIPNPYDSVLSARIPDKWTEDHRLDGAAYLVVWAAYNETVFSGGMPNLTIKTHGKPIYDLRTGSIAHTENPAICLYDYLTNDDYGLGIDAADIDTDTFITAANICDQSVNSTTRYRIHGMLSTADSPEANIQKILDSCAGSLVNVGGYWKFYAGAWRSPSVSLDESDLVGPLRYTSANSRRDIFNSVKGVFVDPETSQPADYPSVQSSAWIDEDGETIWRDLPLEMVNDADQCQRLAYIYMEKNRQGISLDYPVSLAKGLNLIPGDVVQVSNTKYGWTNKFFEVVEWDLIPGKGSAIIVKLSLMETAAEIYDDWLTDGYDPSPNTNIPDPRQVAVPTDLAASETLFAEGDIVSNLVRLTWTASSAYFVSGYDVKYQKDGGDEVVVGTNVPGTAAEFKLMDTGDFTFYVRAKNSLGGVSTWAEATKTIYGKTANPSDVSNLTISHTSEGSILTWDQVTDLDLSAYEVREGSATWNEATRKWVGKVTWCNRGFFTPASYQYQVKAWDTTGHLSDNAATVSFTIVGPTINAIDVAAQTISGLVIISWSTTGAESYPIKYYKVYKGDTFATAELLAVVNSNYLQIQETASGTYKYWVVAYDAAGNQSTQVSKTVEVDNPPDFVLTTADSDDFTGGTDTNFYTDPEGNIIPLVDESETWSDWWDRAGATTWQDFIDADQEKWLEPMEETAQYVYEIDLGVTLKQSRVSVSTTKSQQDEDIEETPTISVSNDGLTWVDYVGVYRTVAVNFRYIKITLDYADAGNGKSLVYLTALQTQVDAKKQTESGTATVAAADSGGTTINFSNSYADVISITVSPNSAAGYFAAYDFNHSTVPAPGSFKGLLFDGATRVDGEISYYVEGY